jgi:hypothetical protein
VLSRSRRALPVAAEVFVEQLTRTLERLVGVSRPVEERMPAPAEPT